MLHSACLANLELFAGCAPNLVLGRKTGLDFLGFPWILSSESSNAPSDSRSRTAEDRVASPALRPTLLRSPPKFVRPANHPRQCRQQTLVQRIGRHSRKSGGQARLG